MTVLLNQRVKMANVSFSLDSPVRIQSSKVPKWYASFVLSLNIVIDLALELLQYCAAVLASVACSAARLSRVCALEKEGST